MYSNKGCDKGRADVTGGDLCLLWNLDKGDDCDVSRQTCSPELYDVRQ